MDHHDDQNYLFNTVDTLVRHVYASVNRNLIYSYAQGVSSVLSFSHLSHLPSGGTGDLF